MTHDRAKKCNPFCAFTLRYEKINSIRIISSPLLSSSLPLGFFDRASQENGAKCGARVVLKLREEHISLLKMGYVRGTNSCGEMLGVWILLYFSRTKFISNLQLFGVSKVILFGYQTRVDYKLWHWKDGIRRRSRSSLLNLCMWTFIIYIGSTMGKKTSCQKQTLDLAEGKIFVSKFVGDTLNFETSIFVFWRKYSLLLLIVLSKTDCIWTCVFLGGYLYLIVGVIGDNFLDGSEEMWFFSGRGVWYFLALFCYGE